MGMVSDFVLGSYVLDGMGMVSDFVLGSYVLSSKPKTKSDTHEGLASFNPLPAMKPGGTGSHGRRSGPVSCFNPLPAMKPGGTSGRTSRGPHPPAFQSAPGDEAGRNSGPRASLPPFLRFNPLP